MSKTTPSQAHPVTEKRRFQSSTFVLFPTEGNHDLAKNWCGAIVTEYGVVRVFMVEASTKSKGLTILNVARHGDIYERTYFRPFNDRGLAKVAAAFAREFLT